MQVLKDLDIQGILVLVSGLIIVVRCWDHMPYNFVRIPPYGGFLVLTWKLALVGSETSWVTAWCLITALYFVGEPLWKRRVS